MKEELNQLYRRIRNLLTPRYGDQEASAMAFAFLEDKYDASRTDVLCGKVRDFSEKEHQEMEDLLQQLVEGNPLQYVLGQSFFYGRSFIVSPAVLIPRPETEALVEMVVQEQPESVLDCGTGSGCIAVSIAAELPTSRVTAWDISDEALCVAKENAAALGATVTFQKRDILEESTVENTGERYACIVSNPPYICHREASEMEQHVLDHEPHLALFVPDQDPLLFYRALAELANRRLLLGGLLCVETNKAYTRETAELFSSFGFEDIEIIEDCFSVPRFVKARKA